MFLTYAPLNGDGTSAPPQRWVFKPERMNDFESIALEQRTGLDWDEFLIRLQKGNTAARKALLWVFLRREHPKLRYEDVSFTRGELELSYDKAELIERRDTVPMSAFPSPAIYEAAMETINREIEDAPEDPAPKAPASVGD